MQLKTKQKANSLLKQRFEHEANWNGSRKGKYNTWKERKVNKMEKLFT